jgi:hypothetical protein
MQTPATDIANAKAEFWGDLQKDFYTETSTLYLANQTLESVLSTNGRKAHKPIISQPTVRDYTPHSDLTFDVKKAESQNLEVSQFPTAAEIIDITEKFQNPYDLLAHASRGIRQGLINRTEQLFLSNVTSASHAINGGTALELSASNVGDVIEEADGTLGSFDIPYETSMRALVVGPRTLALLRKVRSDKETPLGDRTDAQGVVGPWRGWTVVANNNLPWSATLTIATTPTNLDTVTIMNTVFEFRSTIGSGTAGRVGVLIGGSASASRTNLKNAIEGAAGTPGTDYLAMDNLRQFVVRNKRRLRITISSNDMLFTGFGDITVSETLTAAADVWSAHKQNSVFMMRGAIDLVMQFMELDIANAENRFADKPKGIIGVGSKMFQDGAVASVLLPLDVSGWNA